MSHNSQILAALPVIQEEQLVQTWRDDIGRTQTIYNLSYVGFSMIIGEIMLNSTNLYVDDQLIDVEFNNSQPEYRDFVASISTLADNENITVIFSDAFVNNTSSLPGASGSSTKPVKRLDLMPELNLNYTKIVITSESLQYTSDGQYNYLSGDIVVKFYALVTINDSTPPDVFMYRYRFNETTFILNWTIFDQFPKNYTIYIDGVIVEQANLVSEDIGIVILGEQNQILNVTLVVFDEFDNKFVRSYLVVFDVPNSTINITNSTSEAIQNSKFTSPVTLPSITFTLAIISISTVTLIRKYIRL